MKRRTFLLFVCSIMLAISTSGCDKLEKHSGGLLVTMSIFQLINGHCVTTAALTDGVDSCFPSSATMLPKLKCKDSSQYFVGPLEADAQPAVDLANEYLTELQVEYTRVAALAGGEPECAFSAGITANIMAAMQTAADVHGDAVADAGAGGTGCVQLIAPPGKYIVFCLAEAGRAVYANAKRYTLMTDARTDVAFATHFGTLVAAKAAARYTNGFSEEAITNAATIDAGWAGEVFATLSGWSYFMNLQYAQLDGANAAHYLACRDWFATNVDPLKQQLAREYGITEDWEIDAAYVSKYVNSIVVYDMMTWGTRMVGLGTLCMRDATASGCADLGVDNVSGAPMAPQCNNSPNLPAFWDPTAI